MIHNILAYTQDGKILYSWELKPNSLTETEKILIPGFFSAINSMIGDIFQGRIQRIEFRNKNIVLSGKEVTIESQSKWILFSVLIDSTDNNSLVDRLTVEIMHLVLSHIDQKYEKLNQYKMLDNKLNRLINSKSYDRTTLKITISSLLIALSINITVLTYAFIRSYKSTFDSSNVFSIISALIIGGITLTFSASVAGSKKYSTIIGLLFSFAGSIIAFYLVEIILSEVNWLGGLGNIWVFITFCSLIGCIFGFIGGMLIDNKYLYK